MTHSEGVKCTRLRDKIADMKEPMFVLPHGAFIKPSVHGWDIQKTYIILHKKTSKDLSTPTLHSKLFCKDTCHNRVHLQFGVSIALC